MGDNFIGDWEKKVIGWKAGKLGGWKAGRPEGWKAGRLGGWKIKFEVISSK